MFARILSHVFKSFKPHDTAGVAIDCQFAQVLKNTYHADNGQFTDKSHAVQAGHKKNPTVDVMQQAMDKVGMKAFEDAVASHLAKLGELSPDDFAHEIERVARTLLRKRDFSLVLKFNPYHGPDGRFATHGSATFVSLSGKKYADILAPGNKNKNVIATSQQMGYLKYSSYALGNILRNTPPSDMSAEGKAKYNDFNLQLAIQAKDKAMLAAAGADVYGKGMGLGEATLQNAIAAAFGKSHLSTQTKQNLNIPLTTEEQALMDAGLAKQAEAKAVAAAKPVNEQAAAAKAYSSAYVKTMMAHEKALYQDSPAEAAQLSQKMKDLAQAYLATGATDQQLGKLAQAGFAKVEAKKEDLKAKATALALEYYKANFGYSNSSSYTGADPAPLKKKANKLWVDNKYFMGTDPAPVIGPAKQAFEDWKEGLMVAHNNATKNFAEGAISKESYHFHLAGMKAKGFTDDAMGKFSSPEAIAAKAKMQQEQAVLDTKKAGLVKELKNATVLLHTASLQGGTPEHVAELKALQETAKHAAIDSGMLDHDATLTVMDKAKWDVETTHAAVVKVAVASITKVAHGMTSARLSGDTAMAEDQAGHLHSTVETYMGMVSKEQIAAAKIAGVEAATKSHALQKAFKDAIGDPNKTAAAYDEAMGTFEYPKGDKAFAKQQDAQVNSLPENTVSILKSYTGSSYTEINKAVGKYGTAKMNGLEPPELSSYEKGTAIRMDKAFAQITLGQNVALRRNMPQKYFWNQLGIDTEAMRHMSQEQVDAFVGKTYKETAYGSASMDENFGGAYSKEMEKTGGMILRIRAGADINAVRVASISSHNHEEEVIMGRGTTYVIRSIKKIGVGEKYEYEVFADAIGVYPDAL